LDFIAKDKQSNIKTKIAECIDTALKRHIGSDKAKPLRITVNDKIIQLDMDEIIYIETTHVRHKLRVHTKNRIMEFNGELKNIEEKLDERFIRCHKCYIINKNKIAAINKKANTAIMINNGVCHVSRNGMKLLLVK
jgi:two-component system response regulator AgrA